MLLDMIDEEDEDEEVSNQIYDCLLAAGSKLISFII